MIRRVRLAGPGRLFTVGAIATATACAFACLPQSAAAASPASPDFERQILPLFYGRCFSCHSEKVAEPKADLRLDSAEAILESRAIVPGKPD